MIANDVRGDGKSYDDLFSELPSLLACQNHSVETLSRIDRQKTLPFCE